MNQREQLAKENDMSIDFVNWFFDNKKEGCGNVWFMMMAAMWEGWKPQSEQVRQLTEQRDAVVAENATLKSGHLFFMYSDETGFEIHKTQDAALASAKDMMAVCREEAAQDGWPEDTDTICWGLIMQKAIEIDFEKPSEQNGWIGWSEYKLTPDIKTPATDAAIAALRAEGVEMFAEHLSGMGIMASETSVKEFARQLRESKDIPVELQLLNKLRESKGAQS